MQDMLLMILLDGFRHDYLCYTSYLQRLGRASLVGRFMEPFGFCPRPAYFGGLNPAQSGFTNMFWLDPANSPFSAARFLDLEAVRSLPSLQDSARRFVEDLARSRCSRFAASYISSLAIPLPYLHLFDVTEKAAPWDPDVGYRSIFHALDEKGIPWFECSWPQFSGLKAPADSEILEHTIGRLTGEHAFAFIHFGSLDGIGHAFGAGSRECVDAVKRLDRLVENMVHHCSLCHDRLNVIIFGDHGMVTVAKNVDVSRSLAETGLAPGRDFFHFIDSTMVRFWFATRGARRIVEERLAALPEGYVVNETIRQQLGTAGCDPRNGELFFLAHPGVQFFPNFFQSTGAPPKGMHGYHPDCPDNQALFLLHTHRQNPGPWATPIRATQVFHTSCDLLGIDNISFDRTASLLHEKYRTSYTSRFTIAPDPEITEVVQGHLDLIVEDIRQAAPDTEAILLTGGFGRGEGSVISSGGNHRPLNDYDLLVACDEGLRSKLKSVGCRLAGKIGIDYVDIGPLHPDWFDKLRLTLFAFDVKYGTQTIWGNESLLESIPAFAPSEIPLEEGYQLLQNRIAGLLLGLKPHLFQSTQWAESESAFLIHQIAKAAISIGDFRLLSLGDYSCSYKQRLDRLLNLRHALGIGGSEVQLLERAYSFKLLPDYAQLSPAVTFLFPLLEHLRASFVFATCRLLGLPATEVRSIPEAVSRWEARYADSIGREMAALRASLVLLAFSIENGFALDAGMLQEALSRYRTLQADADPDSLSHLSEVELYSELRSKLLRKWEDQCH